MCGYFIFTHVNLLFFLIESHDTKKEHNVSVLYVFKCVKIDGESSILGLRDLVYAGSLQFPQFAPSPNIHIW